MNNVIVLCLGIIVASFLLYIYWYNTNPYEDACPVRHIDFDISRKRNVDYDEYIEQWIIDNQDLIKDSMTEKLQEQWKQKILSETSNKHRCQQIMDEYNRARLHPYVVTFYRDQVRYRQSNYAKTVHIVQNIDQRFYISSDHMAEIYNSLKNIDFCATLKKFNTKNQRSLMTPQLRQKIKLRDNYTCQCCGKYMPDEIGLQIDHIVPISCGGKTVESNLQVLCSKCNLQKGKKKPLQCN